MAGIFRVAETAAATDASRALGTRLDRSSEPVVPCMRDGIHAADAADGRNDDLADLAAESVPSAPTRPLRVPGSAAGPPMLGARLVAQLRAAGTGSALVAVGNPASHLAATPRAAVHVAALARFAPDVPETDEILRALEHEGAPDDLAVITTRPSPETGRARCVGGSEDGAVQSLVHVPHEDGLVLRDGSVIPPLVVMQHEAQHAIDPRRACLGTGPGLPELDAADPQFTKKAERRAVGAENAIASFRKEGIRTSYGDGEAEFIRVRAFASTEPKDPVDARRLARYRSSLARLDGHLRNLRAKADDPATRGGARRASASRRNRRANHSAASLEPPTRRSARATVRRVSSSASRRAPRRRRPTVRLRYGRRRFASARRTIGSAASASVA